MTLQHKVSTFYLIRETKAYDSIRDGSSDSNHTYSVNKLTVPSSVTSICSEVGNYYFFLTMLRQFCGLHHLQIFCLGMKIVSVKGGYNGLHIIFCV